MQTHGGLDLKIEKIEIDGEFRDVVSSNTFIKGDEFRAVVNVNIEDNKIPLDNVGKVIILHGVYHSEPIRIHIEKADIIEDRGDSVSICVFSERKCHNAKCKKESCTNGEYRTIINNTGGCNTSKNLVIFESEEWSLKHHKRLDDLLQEYRDISGNDMVIEDGDFVLRNNGTEIREKVELSRIHLKKKHLVQTGIMLRRLFYDMLKQTK